MNDNALLILLAVPICVMPWTWAAIVTSLAFHLPSRGSLVDPLRVFLASALAVLYLYPSKNRAIQLGFVPYFHFGGRA